MPLGERWNQQRLSETCTQLDKKERKSQMGFQLGSRTTPLPSTAVVLHIASGKGLDLVAAQQGYLVLISAVTELLPL